MKTNCFRKMSSSMQLWAIPMTVGFFLILSGLGIVFILDLKVLAAMVSGFMFLSGLLGIAYIYANNKRFDGWSFYLMLAGLDFVLGSLLIISSEIKITTIAMVLSFWIVFQGLGKIIYSMDFQKLGIRNWDSDLITGILFVVYGAVSIPMMSLSPAFILLATAIVLSLAGLSQITLSLKRQAEYKSMHEVRVAPVRVSLRATGK